MFLPFLYSHFIPDFITNVMGSKLDVALFQVRFSCYASLKLISEKTVSSLVRREFSILNRIVLSKSLILFAFLKAFLSTNTFLRRKPYCLFTQLSSSAFSFFFSEK